MDRKGRKPLRFAPTVLLGPAFLQRNDMWLRVGDSELATDLTHALATQLGDVLESPAVEREDRDFGGQFLHCDRYSSTLCLAGAHLPLTRCQGAEQPEI